MAEVQVRLGDAEHQISGSTLLYAAIASVVIGGPLLGMMGFTLLATTTLALVAAPLMLLFSPVIVPAAIVLVGTVVAFGIAVVMAFIGLAMLTWAFRSLAGFGPGGLERVMGKLRGSAERGMDFGGYIKQKGDAYEPRIWQQRS